MSEKEPRDHYDEKLDLPRSYESEQGVIGGILLSNVVLDRIGGMLKPEHFFDPFHQRAYECMQRLQESSRLITPASMATFLGDYDLGQGVKPAQYLARLAANGFVIAEAVDAARTVKELHDRRRIIEQANYLKGVAYDAPIEARPAQIAAKAIEELDAIVQEADTHNYRMSAGSALQASIDDIEAQLAGREAPGTSTGFVAIDNKLGRMRPGDLVVLAGRPGMGKSMVAVEMAMNIALRGEVVAIFSLEMSAPQIAERMASSWMLRTNQPAIPYNLMAEPKKLSDEQFGRIIMAKREIDKLPIEIDAQPGLSLSQISARARRYRQRAAAHGLKLGAVIVDHLGIMQAPRGAQSREQEVAKISGGLKVLAKEIGAPLIALAQLSRRVEERKIEDRRPQMADLRESGAIEQDADIILGAFRLAYYLKDLPEPDDKQVAMLNRSKNEIEIGIMKNRHGSTGRAILRCYIGSNRIMDTLEDAQVDLISETEPAF